jgi:hypothetical protein
VANHKKTAKKRKPSNPLPKVGSPKDDAYIMKRSREDLVDFGLGDKRRGPAATVILGLVALLLGVGVVALIIFT